MISQRRPSKMTPLVLRAIDALLRYDAASIMNIDQPESRIFSVREAMLRRIDWNRLLTVCAMRVLRVEKQNARPIWYQLINFAT